VALDALLDGTLAFLHEKFQRRGIEVRRDFAPVPSVRGEPERLQQLFLNLFMNAADAMPEGGDLCVRLRPLGDEVEIEVADTGAGIEDKDVPRLFEPFFTTKAAGEGHGLGLAVCQGIVADHHGTIEVRSRCGEGTTFRIALPLAKVTGAGA
jgi:signal transduction histidine kinase